MRTRAIVNPRSAGGRTGRSWPALQDRLRADLPDLDSVLTERTGDATRLAREAVAEGVEQILAVGGDGTVNEIVNGLLVDDRPTETVLALMMLGTGGDFRKSFGMQANVDDFIDHLLHGQIRRIDAGRVEMIGHDGTPAVRYFDNIASFGASGKLVDRMNHATLAKKLLPGRLAFFWVTIRTLLTYRAPLVRVRIDDEFDDEVRPSLVAICNGQYFGGGMWPAPKAELDDGLFDIVIGSEVGTLQFIRNSSKFYRGEHLSLPHVRFVRGRRLTATVVSGEALPLDVDGECPGRLPATYEIVPGALRIRCKEPSP